MPGDGPEILVCWLLIRKVCIRLLTEDKSHYVYYEEETPELAIAVLPELIESARCRVPAIMLTVYGLRQSYL